MEKDQASEVTPPPWEPPPTDQAEGVNELSKSSPDWQSSMCGVRERNAVMLKEALLADVYFTVGSGSTQRRIAAHKCMLVAASSVFHAMFFGELAEDKEVAIPDVEPEAFLNMLTYVYCDEISMEANTVLSTLYAAKKYIFPHLASACVEYLETQLDASNVCLLLSHSSLFDDQELMQRCWNVIDIGAEEVVQSDSFTDIDFKTLQAILSRDTLDAKETTLFAAAIRWAEAECTRQGRDTSPQECREVLGEALYLLRFPTMTPRDFADGAGKSGLLSLQETCDLFFYFTATDKPKLRFPTTCRKKRLRRCLRFGACSILSQTGWKYEGKCDSIQFSVDKCISVVGFGLYGSLDSSKEYRVSVVLKRGDNQLYSMSHGILCDGSSNRFDVHFDTPFQIEANTYYTANLYLRNKNHGYYGHQGMSDVCCDGINFNFKMSSDSTNSTGVSAGQIPEILFHR